MSAINHNNFDFQTLKKCITKPRLYEPSESKFWDDPYISAQMLKLHLAPEVESASRSQAIIQAESAFIIGQTGIGVGKSVLDLGCGPGLYVKEFAKTGAQITGVDLSACSIRYATQNIQPSFSNIAAFTQMNYLNLTIEASFDVITMIFYDFCVLTPDEQKKLLQKIHVALKADGKFVFDVISEDFKVQEANHIAVSEGDGFWSPNPYIEIANTYLYDKPKTMGQQFTILSEDGSVAITRIYTRFFNIEDLMALLIECGFRVKKIFKNLRGEPLDEDSETYGVFAEKI